MSDDQLPLDGMPRPRAVTVQARRRGSRPTGAGASDDPLPVARVAVLTALPHLDRLFDYTVPGALSEAARPGVRVRVRLAGRLHDGYVIERVAGPQEPGRQLQPISSVHGPPVLTAEIAQLCRAVADRYAGTFADVVRAAVPPRHARVEARFARPVASTDDPPTSVESLPPAAAGGAGRVLDRAGAASVEGPRAEGLGAGRLGAERQDAGEPAAGGLGARGSGAGSSVAEGPSAGGPSAGGPGAGGLGVEDSGAEDSGAASLCAEDSGTGGLGAGGLGAEDSGAVSLRAGEPGVGGPGAGEPGAGGLVAGGRGAEGPGAGSPGAEGPSLGGPIGRGSPAAMPKATPEAAAGSLDPVAPSSIDSLHARAPRLDRAPWLDRAAWRAYRGGPQLVAALAAGTTVRASWLTGPGEDVPTRVAELCALVAAGGRGALVVGPDVSDVQRVVEALAAADVPYVNLSARSGPEARYRAFLRVLHGETRVVVGTRGAVFAPVADLGLMVVLQDGDDSLAEPHAPGWHAREVAALRSVAEDATLVLAGPAVSLEAERMVAVGWATPLGLPRTTLRARAPLVQAAAQAAHDDPARAAARIPGVALEVLREAVDRGPVLVSVPRAGYLRFLVCDTCREQVLCLTCASPMRAHGPGLTPTCADHPEQPPWHCPHCGGARIRAGVVGVRRTAEEFGRALPGVPVHSSSGDTILRSTPPRRALVVATPGAEPDPGPEGYAALVLLDVGAALTRPGLRVGEEVLRRWLSAAALVRPASAGGRVLVVGDEGLREVQALVRWDPRGYAHRELDERLVLALPPAVRTARLTGPESEVQGVVEHLQEQLRHRLRRCSGPLPVAGTSTGSSDTDDRASWLVGVSLSDGQTLTSLLQQIAVRRSMRGAPVVRVRVDPITA